jgi:hypothetical protein
MLAATAAGKAPSLLPALYSCSRTPALCYFRLGRWEFGIVNAIVVVILDVVAK